jgi:hypothetical protein
LRIVQHDSYNQLKPVSLAVKNIKMEKVRNKFLSKNFLTLLMGSTLSVKSTTHAFGLNRIRSQPVGAQLCQVHTHCANFVLLKVEKMLILAKFNC